MSNIVGDIMNFEQQTQSSLSSLEKDMQLLKLKCNKLEEIMYLSYINRVVMLEDCFRQLVTTLKAHNIDFVMQRANSDTTDKLSQEHSSDITPQEHRNDKTPEEHRNDKTPQEHRNDKTPQEHRNDKTPEEHRNDKTPQEHHAENSCSGAQNSDQIYNIHVVKQQQQQQHNPSNCDSNMEQEQEETIQDTDESGDVAQCADHDKSMGQFEVPSVCETSSREDNDHIEMPPMKECSVVLKMLPQFVINRYDRRRKLRERCLSGVVSKLHKTQTPKGSANREYMTPELRRQHLKNVGLPSTDSSTRIEKKKKAVVPTDVGQKVRNVGHRRVTVGGQMAVTDVGRQTVTDGGRQTVTDVSRQTVTDGGQMVLTGGGRQTVTDGGQMVVTGGGRQTVTDGGQMVVTGGGRQTVTDGGQMVLTGGGRQTVTDGGQMVLTGGGRQTVTDGGQMGAFKYVPGKFVPVQTEMVVTDGGQMVVTDVGHASEECVFCKLIMKRTTIVPVGYDTWRVDNNHCSGRRDCQMADCVFAVFCVTCDRPVAVDGTQRKLRDVLKEQLLLVASHEADHPYHCDHHPHHQQQGAGGCRQGILDHFKDHREHGMKVCVVESSEGRPELLWEKRDRWSWLVLRGRRLTHGM